MTTAGLTYTEQRPPSPTASVSVDDAAPGEVWRDLADADEFQSAVVSAALDALRGRTYVEAMDALEAAGVDAGGGFRSLLLHTAQGDETAMWRLLRETRRLSSGRRTFDDVLGAARVFALALEAAPERDAPTVEVRVPSSFRETRANQRRDFCRLVDTLADGCDVRLVSTGLVRRWLAETHRGDLTGVSEACNTTPTRRPVPAVVEAARDALGAESREVAVLRDVADAPAETLAYSALASRHAVSASRVRQVVSRLTDLDLVDTFDAADGRRVELLETGRDFISALDADIGRQSRITDCVSGTGKDSIQSRVTTRKDGRGDREGRPTTAAADKSLSADADGGSLPPHSSGEADAERSPEAEGGTVSGEPQQQRGATPYRTRYLDRASHHGAAGAARDGAVVLVEDAVGAEADADLRDAVDAEAHRRTRWVSYNSSRDEAVVAVRATGPLQYAVSVATALASPRFLDTALPAERLDDLDVPDVILRKARCIGWLSTEAADDGATFRDALVEAGERLADLTRQQAAEDYEDRGALRGEILDKAHGLAGTVAHLLDAAGVDLVREVRVPGGLDLETDLAPLARTLSISATIQSSYGAFAAYRQLYEQRDDKRETALSPEVDAADPYGSLVGSFVVRGPDVHRLEASLSSALRSPRELHDDAPEFAVPVPLVDGAGRAGYADAVRRMCDEKNLEPTRRAVSMFTALASSPQAAARGLGGGLTTEPTPRDIGGDEVRVALSTLPETRMLPSAVPTVRRMLSALLLADERLTQTALADQAGVSTRSVRTHLGRLEAFGLVDETADGYRLALPFLAERYADDAEAVDVGAWPWFAVPNAERGRGDYRDATGKGVILEALDEAPPSGPDDDPDAVSTIGAALGGAPVAGLTDEVRAPVVEAWPWSEPLVDVVALVAVGEPSDDALEAGVTSRVVFGAAVDEIPKAADDSGEATAPGVP